MIWRKSPSGLILVCARSLLDIKDRDWLGQSKFLPRNLPVENPECLRSLDDMCTLDAERVLCLECYQLKISFSLARAKRPTVPAVQDYEIPTIHGDVRFQISNGSELFRPSASAGERRFLVVAAIPAFAPVRHRYYLLGVEPEGRFWKRVGVFTLEVLTDQLKALQTLDLCRTRVLLI